MSEIPQVSIISDNDAALWAVAEGIRSAGFEVEVFGSAEKFILSHKVTGTACLIVDAQLAGMSGLQLQSHLAAAGRHIPMVFVVAHEYERAQSLALRALLGEVRAILNQGT